MPACLPASLPARPGPISPPNVSWECPLHMLHLPAPPPHSPHPSHPSHPHPPPPRTHPHLDIDGPLPLEVLEGCLDLAPQPRQVSDVKVVQLSVGGHLERRKEGGKKGGQESKKNQGPAWKQNKGGRQMEAIKREKKKIISQAIGDTCSSKRQGQKEGSPPAATAAACPSCCCCRPPAPLGWGRRRALQGTRGGGQP